MREDLGLIPGVGNIPWRRTWQLTPGFLPGEFHGQRFLMGYSPWGHKELDTTEQLGIAQHRIRDNQRNRFRKCRPPPSWKKEKKKCRLRAAPRMQDVDLIHTLFGTLLPAWTRLHWVFCPYGFPFNIQSPRNLSWALLPAWASYLPFSTQTCSVPSLPSLWPEPYSFCLFYKTIDYINGLIASGLQIGLASRKPREEIRGGGENGVKTIISSLAVTWGWLCVPQ